MLVVSSSTPSGNKLETNDKVIEYLPVLIEPVIGLGLGVKGVTEVGWTGAGNPVHGATVHLEVVGQLLVSTLVVLLHDAKVTNWSA